MDGLDDQAQATLASIIEQLYTNHVVQVKHSSRDLILLGLTEALKTASRPILARKLVLRSGVSVTAIGWLQDALLETKGCHEITELVVCSLQDTTALSKVFDLCQACQITKLTLASFLSRARGRHNMVAETIRSGLLLLRFEEDDDEEVAPAAATGQLGFYDVLSGQNAQTVTQERLDQLRISVKESSSNTNYSCLTYLEVRNYPIGVAGTQVLSTAPVATAGLQTLKLLDCNLQSDSANYLAKLLTPKLQILDLSHNRHFRSKLTREMTIKTIVRRGNLQDNLSLLQLLMKGVDKDINRSKLDRHLAINRLLLAFAESSSSQGSKTGDQMVVYGIHPGIFCHLLGRVSVKPAAVYFFLQQTITTMFA